MKALSLKVSGLQVVAIKAAKTLVQKLANTINTAQPIVDTVKLLNRTAAPMVPNKHGWMNFQILASYGAGLSVPHTLKQPYP
jgi:hypothetical protein